MRCSELRALAFSYRARLIRPAQSRAVLPAMKPGTARAFASRRRAHSRAPGPESLSLGSLIWLSFLQEENADSSLLGGSNFARRLENRGRGGGAASQAGVLSPAV